MCRHLWHIRKIFENLLVSENFVRGASDRMKTALGILQLWFNYFAASFFKALLIHFARDFK